MATNGSPVAVSAVWTDTTACPVRGARQGAAKSPIANLLQFNLSIVSMYKVGFISSTQSPILRDNSLHLFEAEGRS